ncbi:MAG: ATP-binding cassette domain-containing protein, partial [Gammaproteobacteria bacterium]|nr:ATP-binding cassette domain-containing protein [Gammaproteobacteria bacterium]
MYERKLGDVVLQVDGISLSFGAMRVLNNISFNVRQGEIRSIIGPNGAGKSSMLNVINGVYHPQQGAITYRGKTRDLMKVHEAAQQGIARTF